MAETGRRCAPSLLKLTTTAAARPAVVLFEDDAVRAIVVALELLVRRYRVDALPVPPVVTTLLTALNRPGPTEPPSWFAAPDDRPVLIDLTAAAQRLGVGRRTVERLVATGALPSLLVGRRRLVHVDDLARYIQHRQEGSDHARD